MSKRIKISPSRESFSFMDLPSEMIDYVADSLDTGVARRKLSGSSKYLHTLLSSVPRSQKIRELKETMLEYYYSKKVTSSLQDPEDSFIDVNGIPLKIGHVVHALERTNIFLIDIGMPIFYQNNPEDNVDVAITLRPVDDLPELVRTIMAFIFHTYYVSVKTLPPILEIYFALFSETKLGDFRMTWVSFKSFVENNPFRLLLNALLQKYENLRYTNNLPLLMDVKCDTTYKDLYMNEIEPFKVENNLSIYEIEEQDQNSYKLYFDCKFPRPSKTIRGDCSINAKDAIVFTLFYKLFEKDFIAGFIAQDDINTIANEILKTIHMVLPECVRLMGRNTIASALVYIYLIFPKNRIFAVPYFFTMQGNSYLCRESYANIYSAIESWLMESPQILINNSFYTFLIHSDLTIELKQEDYHHFKTLS